MRQENTCLDMKINVRLVVSEAPWEVHADTAFAESDTNTASCSTGTHTRAMYSQSHKIYDHN